ncbi:DUF6505 family protein [Ferrovibrio sp.]|uniref:DUF6505 family protein n=1 Tax=Ferrovibrio sp. TaxID=1917215 RepID=UPI001B633F10|nr:DUF6505 family protein [Ferrovibrio sp.]MBP7064385.1 hypothetical protein [Ferrovibrio sp.]
MIRKLPRCIQLDATDSRIFDPCAQPGEWAVPGAFMFADIAPEAIAGKTRQAFANGFLGIASFGWTTLVSVASVPEAEFEAAVTLLAQQIGRRFNPPSRAAAEAAAREELEYAAGLCEHPVNTLLALSRRLEGEHIVEQFRVVTPPGEKPHAKLWEIVADEP